VVRQPVIVCAAMLMDDHHIITGVRHYSPDMRQTLSRIYGPRYHMRVLEQGFITNGGMFVSRKNALTIARENNQIRRESPENMNELYSENLY